MAEPVVIALSGATTSGKTSVALILEEIFSYKNKDVTVIHEDEYFVTKELCPLVTFGSASTNSEREFMQASKENDKLGLYIITEKEESKDFTITGPDTDCWSAVDVDKLIDAISAAKYPVKDDENILKPPQTPISKSDQKQRRIDKSPAVSKENKIAVEDHKLLISEMKGRVHQFLQQQSKEQSMRDGFNLNSHAYKLTARLPPIVFVEGFLLYTAPGRSDGGRLSLMQEIAKDHPDKVDTTKEHVTTMDSRHMLMDMLDIKLFLPVSFPTANFRRFSLTNYTQPPFGTRLPGQMWKSQGYFTSVVWPNFRNAHGFLFQDGDVNGHSLAWRSDTTWSNPGDIMVREGIDDGLRSTVKWATDAILTKLAERMRAEGAYNGRLGLVGRHSILPDWEEPREKTRMEKFKYRIEQFDWRHKVKGWGVEAKNVWKEAKEDFKKGCKELGLVKKKVWEID